MPLYHPDNYRDPQQLAKMLRLEAEGICIFCPDAAEGITGKAVHRSAHWTVAPNDYPYRGTRLHLLLVPNEHVTDLLDLSPAAQADFWSALGWVREHHRLTYYGLGARNGDCACTGGTIYHLHVHVLVGDVTDPDHEPVRMRFSARRDAG